MVHKIGAINFVSDKGMTVISKLSLLNSSLKELALEQDKEKLATITKLAQEFETSIDEYKNSLLDAIQEIVNESDEISGSQEENGIRL